MIFKSRVRGDAAFLLNGRVVLAGVSGYREGGSGVSDGDSVVDGDDLGGEPEDAKCSSILWGRSGFSRPLGGVKEIEDGNFDEVDELGEEIEPVIGVG